MDPPVYRMSTSGYCSRVLGAMRLNETPTPESETSKRIREEGQRHEPWVLEELERESGLPVTDRQKEIVIVHPLFHLIGHLDGIHNNMLVEVKSFGLFQYRKLKTDGLSAFPEYESQITCYMSATSLPCLFPAKCRDNGEIWKMEIFKPPLNISDVMGKIAWVEVLARRGELPEGDYEEDSTQCHWCHYKHLCVREKKLDVVASPQIEEAAEMWREGKSYQRIANDKLDSARAILEEYLTRSGKDRERIADLLLQWRTRKTYSEARLKSMIPQEVLDSVANVSKFMDVRDIRDS